MGTIRKTGRGLYTTQFTAYRKRYTVYGKTKKECQNKELAKRKEIEEAHAKAEKEEAARAKAKENGLDPDGALLTLDQYFDKWLYLKRGVRLETTIRSNEMMYKNISQYVTDKGIRFGEQKLEDITIMQVKGLQTAMIKAGKSTRTTNDTISFLTGILQAATDEHIIGWNPAKAVKALRRTEEKAADTIHRSLTRDETRLFMETAKEMNSWYYPLYTFLLNTGLRVGEAGAVMRSDIRDGRLYVSRTITRTEGGGYKVGDCPKTAAGNRDFKLRPDALEAIRDQQRTNGLRQEGTKFSPDEPVFRTVRGTLLKASLVNTDIARICKKAGIQKFTVHAFRDTFCTRCIEEGMPIRELMKVMGHTNVSMTLGLYAHADEELTDKDLMAVSFY